LGIKFEENDDDTATSKENSYNQGNSYQTAFSLAVSY
jgi:hypothetical protein